MRNYLGLSEVRPRTRKDMIEFLKDHPTHSERMFSSPIFSRTVKLTWLDTLDSEELDLCYKALEIPYEFTGVKYILDEFNFKHQGAMIFFGGRTSGYLELHGVNVPDEFDRSDMRYGDLRWLSNLVWDFDKTCQLAVDTFVQFAIDNMVERETA